VLYIVSPVLTRPLLTYALLKRRETLLKEMQAKIKVGAIVDRRFGEDDPTMTPEQRAAERFARESQKKLRKESMFNLEEDEEEIQLTHMGQSLFDGEGTRDDFQEDDLSASDDDSDSSKKGKRKRVLEEDDMGGLASESEGEPQPERKKSKKEVMEEVIAKSKFYKYERQKAKEEDDDLRTILDKGLPSVLEMMRGAKRPEPERLPQQQPQPQPLTENIDPGRAALMNGATREAAAKEYDQQLKLLAFDKRSQPTDRTKTEEERAAEEAERLRELEESRLKRMRGEPADESDEEAGPDDLVDIDDEPDDAKQFGLGQPEDRTDLGVEDEDDFIIDEDLVEMDSEADLALSESDASESASEDEEEEDEFTSGLTLPTNADVQSGKASDTDGLAYTYPCPESHEHFLRILGNTGVGNLPTVIQRIRALYHPRLHADNKAKLGVFAGILVEHAAYLANQPVHPPFTILESILRHVHSLAKSHPEAVAAAFRRHLRDIADNRPSNLSSGDLIVLTGVATLFPTSDHFHPVVTPSMLSMGRYLGQSTIDSLGDLAIGAYVGSLCLQYQTLSKRYVPEFVNYSLNALCILSPAEPKRSLGYFPLRKPSQSLRITGLSKPTARKITFWDIRAQPDDPSEKQEELKLSLLGTFTALLDSASALWAEKSAFWEIFVQAQAVLKHLAKTCGKAVPTSLSDQIQQTLDNLDSLLARAKSARRPLLLHNHRPLAIKMAIPKFEESFNPDRHYDPNRERAELAKLKAEHKRERKGALRELRKDAHFISRETLREKRERDAEYDKKYRRLVAEIQGEEGREAKAYAKEKKARQGKR
jgi:nucleolar protein 14